MDGVKDPSVSRGLCEVGSWPMSYLGLSLGGIHAISRLRSRLLRGWQRDLIVGQENVYLVGWINFDFLGLR